MRDFFIYTILCLFCFAPAAAQEVPFEGLHLDDLISIPGERKPGIINHPVSAFELPGFKLLPSGHAHLLIIPEFLYLVCPRSLFRKRTISGVILSGNP